MTDMKKIIVLWQEGRCLYHSHGIRLAHAP